MTQRAASAADTTRLALALARAVTIGLRSWSFYPPEHPAVALAVERLIAAAADACTAGLMQIAVTPRTLLVDGQPIESPDLAVAECAELLHDRDILQFTIVSPPDDAIVRAWLSTLSMDRETRRARGGPAALWAHHPQTAILLEQIDYQEILEREFEEEGAARKDSTWQSIVRSIVAGRSTFTPEEQQRLLEISRDVGAIGELVKDAKEPFCTPDGSPLVTTQAAIVLAVYKHIAGTVAALDPDRGQEVMDQIGLAATGLDPGTALELLLKDEASEEGMKIVSALRKSFDDQQIAMLLAKAMASPGHPTSRLAQVLDTLAPDDERKRRVLALSKQLVSERDLGGKRPIDDIRRSLDELLLKYDESTYVSAQYRETMDVASSRAADLALRGLPPEMPEWMATLGHESVRRLSGQLLIDLLRNETQAARMGETASDMAAFAEELLLAGAFEEAVPVVEALNEIGARKSPPVPKPEACREAVEAIGGATALRECTAAIREQSAAEFKQFERLISAIGTAAVPALIAGYDREDGGGGTERITALLVRLGIPAIPRIAAALDDRKWFVQRELARVLGQIGTAAAVAPLQTLLRGTDHRVMQSAVSSLARIDDPAAARALHTALKAATGEARAAVIAALVGLKHPRVVPMLMRIVQDADPFGAEHPLVLETLEALASLQDDRAVPVVVALVRRRKWLAWGKTSRLRATGLRTLARIATPRAEDALAELRRSGDFFLKRLARRVGAAP
jgi:hypothetical protein